VKYFKNEALISRYIHVYDSCCGRDIWSSFHDKFDEFWFKCHIKISLVIDVLKLNRFKMTGFDLHSEYKLNIKIYRPLQFIIWNEIEKKPDYQRFPTFVLLSMIKLHLLETSEYMNSTYHLRNVDSTAHYTVDWPIHNPHSIEHK
jgi:hypothetical protein